MFTTLTFLMVTAMFVPFAYDKAGVVYGFAKGLLSKI